MPIAPLICVIILLALNVAAAIWLAVLNNNLRSCEQKESNFCPFYTCKTQDPKCGNAAFRLDKDGNKICQTPYISFGTTKISGEAPDIKVPPS